MILEKFVVDISLRKVTCAVCEETCWAVVQRDHSAFKCVNPDCPHKTILYLAPNFFEKVIENLRKSATPKEMDLSKPVRARLSKQFFLSLPSNGLFIMSNIFDAPGQPTYFKPVVPAAEREKQWREIVSKKCNQRFCTIFKNKEEATAYLSALYKRISNS